MKIALYLVLSIAGYVALSYELHWSSVFGIAALMLSHTILEHT